MTTENKPSEERVAAWPMTHGQTLRAILSTLENENERPGGAINDTIWYSRNETLFDFVKSAIEAADAAGAQQAAPSGEAVAVPRGLARSDAEFWMRNRTAIIEACRAEGFTIVSTVAGVRLMKFGKVESQEAHPAPAPAESVRTNAVPAGFALVPVEPTPEMLKAIRSGWEYACDCKADGIEGEASSPPRQAYRAMLSAAPPPPSQPPSAANEQKGGE